MEFTEILRVYKQCNIHQASPLPENELKTKLQTMVMPVDTIETNMIATDRNHQKLYPNYR